MRNSTSPLASALTLLPALQRRAVRFLHALSQMQWTGRLRALYMGCLSRTSTPGSWAPIDAAELGPLAVWQQLRSLRIRNLTSFHPDLLDALRQLTALTSLALSAQRGIGVPQLDCGVFHVAGSALTRLESLSINGGQRTSIQCLPDAMSSLTLLRHLEVHGVTILDTCHVILTLTALTRLDIWWGPELPGTMPLWITRCRPARTRCAASWS